MGKVIKGFLYLSGLLISLIVILIIAIPLVIDPNDYRDEIGEIVEQKSGRTLDIKGEIELSLFPWIGIELGRISLSNAAGFGEHPFAEVERVDLKIKLMPLLRKRVEMDTIILHGMTLNLAKLSTGVSNWEDLAESASATPSSESDTPLEQKAPPTTGTPLDREGGQGAQEPTPSATLDALAIGGLEIRDANIHWDDRRAQQKIDLNHFNLVSGAITLESEFPLAIDFNTTINTGGNAGDDAQIEGDISLQSMVGLNLEQQRYHLRQLLLTADLKSQLLPNGQLHSAIRGSLSADLSQQRASAKDLTIKILGTVLTLNSDISHLDKNPLIKGDIHLKVAQAAPLITLLGDALPQTITGKMLETTALTTNFKVNIGPQTVALDKFQLTFDQTTIKGSAAVANFDKPAIGYTFDINRINIDHYFPPDETKQQKEQQPVVTVDNAAPTDEALPIPVELLRALDIDGTLRLGALQVMDLHTSKLVATIKAKGGKITLAPLSAELYQGQFDGAVVVDVRQESPLIKIEERLTGVEAAPLLKDLLGKDYVSGKALLTAHLTTSGDRISQFKKRLNGKAEIRFEDGALNGTDIAQLIRNANALYKKQPTEKLSDNPKTPFGSLSATANIRNGLITNNDLLVKSPLFRIEGSGQADLATEAIDYRAYTLISKNIDAQDDRSLSELKGLTIPLTIKGSFSDPKLGVDLKQLLDAKAKAKVEAIKAKAKQTAQKKVEAVKAEAKQEAQQKIENKQDALKKKLKEKFKLKF